MGKRLPRPFHEADASPRKVFVEPGIEEFFRTRQTIKIKMIQIYSRNCIRFDQGVGRAFHRSGMAQCPQYTSCERGFTAAEIAFEPDFQSWFERGGETRAQRQRGHLVDKPRANRGSVVIGTMNESDHAGDPAKSIATGANLDEPAGVPRRWLAADCHGNMRIIRARHAFGRT